MKLVVDLTIVPPAWQEYANENLSPIHTWDPIYKYNKEKYNTKVLFKEGAIFLVPVSDFKFNYTKVDEYLLIQLNYIGKLPPPPILYRYQMEVLERYVKGSVNVIPDLNAHMLPSKNDELVRWYKKLL